MAATTDIPRTGYPHFLSIATRWMDNDSYGHVNNVTYYSYFDTAVNEHLIRCGGLDIASDPAIGYAVETSCRFAKPLSFPETIDVGLRVVRLGTTSVTYEIGIFRRGDDEPAADGTLRPRVGRSRERAAGADPCAHPRGAPAARGCAMTDMRIGNGFDVHALVAGRRLVLGGVVIPHERGLEGHSDADVLLHAVSRRDPGGARARRYRRALPRFRCPLEGRRQQGAAPPRRVARHGAGLSRRQSRRHRHRAGAQSRAATSRRCARTSPPTSGATSAASASRRRRPSASASRAGARASRQWRVFCCAATRRPLVSQPATELVGIV